MAGRSLARAVPAGELSVEKARERVEQACSAFLDTTLPLPARLGIVTAT